LFLAIYIGTTLAYIVNNWALQHTSPLLIAMYTPVELAWTILFAAIFRGETLVWRQGLGCGLILIGLAIVTYMKYKETASTIEIIEETNDETKLVETKSKKDDVSTTRERERSQESSSE